jgi:hypothetical protein
MKEEKIGHFLIRVNCRDRLTTTTATITTTLSSSTTTTTGKVR